MAKTGNPHGISGYKRRGCRCGVCCAANDAYNQSRRKYKWPAPVLDGGPLVDFVLRVDDRLHSSMLDTLERWRVSGVDVYTIDRQCVSRGVHPVEVYGSEWWLVPIEGANV